MTAIDLDRIATIAREDADSIALTGNGETRTSLRRYRLVRLLSAHTLRELKDALTLREMVAERGRLGRPLVKDDYVNVLVTKALLSLTEN